MIESAIVRLLAAGAGLTADELAEALSLPRAIVRNQLARLIFNAKTVTCDRNGRYRLGDPTTLLEA